MSYVGLFGWHGSTELLPPCAAPLSVFNKVTLIAWCSVSAWRRPIEYPEEAVTRQLKEAVVFFSIKEKGRPDAEAKTLSIYSCTQQKIVSTTWPTPIRELLFQAVKSACIMQEATVCVILNSTEDISKWRQEISCSLQRKNISRCIWILETRRIVIWRWSCILAVMVFVLISRWNWTPSLEIKLPCKIWWTQGRRTIRAIQQNDKGTRKYWPSRSMCLTCKWATYMSNGCRYLHNTRTGIWKSAAGLPLTFSSDKV